MSDESILSLPKEKALELVYKKYSNDILRYSYALVGNQSDADDITSSTFLEFNIKIDSFDWRSVSIKAWLLRTSKFKFYTLIKKNKKVELKNDFFVNLPDISISVENEAINDSVMRKVKDSLKFLSKEEQEIIALRIWEDLKFKEIAEILESNSENIKKKYYRSIDKLKLSINQNKTEITSKKLRLAILYLGDLSRFRKVNAPIANPSQVFMASKYLIPFTLILAIAGIAIIPNTFFNSNKNKDQISSNTNQFPQKNDSNLPDSGNIIPTNTNSNILNKITLKYPGEKVISFKIPSEWKVLKRGFRICTGENNEENGEYAFIYLYSAANDASLELNFSSISDLKLRPNLTDISAINLANINIFEQKISTNAVSSNIVLYNSGQPIIHQDFRFTAFAYSGNLLSNNGAEKTLSAEFISQSGEVLGSLGYE